jgi:hypothetical protein
VELEIRPRAPSAHKIPRPLKKVFGRGPTMRKLSCVPDHPGEFNTLRLLMEAISRGVVYVLERLGISNKESVLLQK